MSLTRNTKLALGLTLLGAGLLVGCTANGPSNLRVHEVTLQGGANERIAWVYGSLSGASSNLKLNGQTVEVRPQVQDDLATPGSLSVNGKATYRVTTAPSAQKLSVTRTASGQFNVMPLNGASLDAVYYTDGQNWWKLSGTSGTVGASASAGLRGAGQLTDAEGDALGRALDGQGSMAVAVLNETTPALSVEPKPTESLQTSLYLLPGIQTLSSTTTPSNTGTVTMTPNTPPPSNQTSGGSFSEVARGTNAKAESFTVLLATTPAQAGNLYALAYGNQSSRPAALSLQNETLVGIFIGRRNTGGYGVNVDSVSASGSTLTVRVTLTTPKEGSLTTQALTSPWVMVRVPGQFTQVNVTDQRGQPLR